MDMVLSAKLHAEIAEALEKAAQDETRSPWDRADLAMRAERFRWLAKRAAELEAKASKSALH
jgi:hypothetical protein